MRLLEILELAEQRVVDVVADLGVVEDVVAVAVVADLLAQLGHPRGRVRRGHSTSSAAGAMSRSRPKPASVSIPARSVRSKWIGVTDRRPSATAARSVPSSCS